MKIINHSVDSGMCGGIILKYILKVYMQTKEAKAKLKGP